MTFADFASIACSKLGELDQGSLTSAQQFAMNRYRIMFNSYAWTETVFNAQVNVFAVTTTGVFTNGSVNVTGIPSTSGMVPGYMIPPTAGIAYGMQVASIVSLTSITLTAPYTGSTGTVAFTVSQDAIFTPSLFGEVITSAWTPSLNLVPIPAQYRELGWIQVNTPGIQLQGISAIVPAYYWQDQTFGVPQQIIAPGTLSFSVQNSGGDNCTITIHGLVTDPVSGQQFEQEEALAIMAVSAQTVFPANQFTQVWSCAKTAGISRITVMANGSNQYVMMPRAEEFKFSQYLFNPVPKTPWIWLPRLKMRCPDENWLLPTDAPVIRNLEDAILAYTQADLLERQRQYSKAGAKAQEAMQLVEEAKKIQTEQSEHYEAIVPEIYDYTNMDGRYIWRPTTSFF